MKTDDPRLESSRKAMLERVEKYNALVLAVIKGHLAIEQAINNFIAASVSNPQYITEDNRLMFAAKANICLSLSYGQHIDNMWSVLWAMNVLRNQVAHSYEPDKIQNKMNNLRSVYMNILTPKQVEGLKSKPDDDIVISACATCAGFIVTIAEEAKARRRVIDEHWKAPA